MNKKLEGCGSSKTVSNLICEPVPPLDCPKEDQFITIDNNQKIGMHSGRIREGSKVPLSICTSMCQIVLQSKTFLQHDNSFNPSNWHSQYSKSELMKRADKLEKDCITEFQRYRGQFIEEIIVSLIEEQNEKENFHYVDIAVANEEEVNTYSKCLNTYIQ